jgi:hypothetical protein
LMLWPEPMVSLIPTTFTLDNAWFCLERK